MEQDLKLSCLKKIDALPFDQQRAAIENARSLLDYVRGNAPIHLGKTRYNERLKRWRF